MRIFGLKSLIRMVTVDLGVKKVQVPVAEIIGKQPGKTLVVTAGMDGDEYAGIAAAYELIDRYADGNFAGRLVVIPVVNVCGFAAECSQNPLDDAFPKNVFPGRTNGSATERLVHWLKDAWFDGADCVFDCHGAAITEGLTPFLWVYRSGNLHAELIDAVIHRSCAELVVEERVGMGTKAHALAKQGCVYILAESGGAGKARAVDISRHLRWIEATMVSLGMIDGRDATEGEVKSAVYQRVSYTIAPCDGIWCPEPFGGSTLESNALLGTYTSLRGTGKTPVYVRHGGVRLWWKETMAMRKGDVLCAVAYNRKEGGV
jgi:predicted deacylase